MSQDPDDPQFQDLRKLLELKRYERPPTEFRSEFMAEFRKRRLAEDERRAIWFRRFWAWLTPDWAGIVRHGAVAAATVLLAANILVMWRNHHYIPARQLTISAPAPVATTALPVTPPTAPASVKPATAEGLAQDDVACAAVYSELNSFYATAEHILNGPADENAEESTEADSIVLASFLQ